MDKLKLKYLAPYLPYGLKLWDAEDKKAIDLISLHTSEEDGDQMEFYAVAEQPSSDWLDLDHPYVKPLLLAFTDYKIWLPKVLKEVSLIEFVETEFECGFDDGIYWCNAVLRGRVIDAIQFDENIFEIMDNEKFSILRPQYLGFEALHKNHVDIYGLVGAGLALNKNHYIK